MSPYWNDEPRTVYINDADPFVVNSVTDTYTRYTRKTLDTVNPNLYREESIQVYHDIILYSDDEKKERNYRSGKKAYYFKRHHHLVYSVRRLNREGKPMFRIFNPKGDFTRTKSHINSNDGHRELARHVGEMMERVTGITVQPEWMESRLFYQMLAYPIFREWTLHHLQAESYLHQQYHKDELRYQNGFHHLSRGFLRSNTRDFVQESFGKKFLRKDFIKAVAAQDDILHLAALSNYRKYFTSDLGLTFLRLDYLTALDELTKDGRLYKKEFDELFKHTTFAQKRRILISEAPARTFYISDTLRIIGNFLEMGYAFDHRQVDFRNWSTMHDTLSYIQRDFFASRRENKLALEGKVEIEQKSHYEVLDNSVVQVDGTDYVIESAKDIFTLRAWGNEMSNCIGGYADSALKHRSYLFGIYENKRLLANMEITPKGKVVQLYGKYNNSLPHEITQSITDYVDSHVVVPT